MTFVLSTDIWSTDIWSTGHFVDRMFSRKDVWSKDVWSKGCFVDMLHKDKRLGPNRMCQFKIYYSRIYCSYENKVQGSFCKQLIIIVSSLTICMDHPEDNEDQIRTFASHHCSLSSIPRLGRGRDWAEVVSYLPHVGGFLRVLRFPPPES